ncbi:MAG: hypothetical protein ACJ77K_10590 [Bacteroidia bacterium]
MKRRGLLLGICLFITSVFTTCKKEDSPVIVVDNGTWKVSYFNKGGDDRTAHFTGYSFRFDKGGKLSANNAGGSNIGSWSCNCENGKMDFIISFNSPPVNELNQTWHIMDQTPKALQLQHVGSSATDYLTFQKE